MARRPKRSLSDELTQHAALARVARDTADALAFMQPDIPEFGVARRLLEDAHTQLLKRLAEPDQAPAQPPLNPGTNTGQAQP